MFLVLAQTNLPGLCDSRCGDEDDWSLPWIAEVSWEDHDLPGTNLEVQKDTTATSIIWANTIDRHWIVE